MLILSCVYLYTIHAIIIIILSFIFDVKRYQCWVQGAECVLVCVKIIKNLARYSLLHLHAFIVQNATPRPIHTFSLWPCFIFPLSNSRDHFVWVYSFLLCVYMCSQQCMGQPNFCWLWPPMQLQYSMQLIKENHLKNYYFRV